VVLSRGERVSIAANEQPRIVSVVAGRVKCGNEELARGENALLSYASAYTFTAVETAILLVTEDFTG
jgi:hypothetical protein